MRGTLSSSMASNLLASLALAGILERSGRGRVVLRVAPRFLAHAEGTAGRLRLQRRGTDLDALEAALATWDEYHHEPRAGAVFLLGLLEERDQLGALRPAFPPLDAFRAVAACA